MREVRLDCRHFASDRPCAAHKRTGAICGRCHEYDPIDRRILIIKLDAMGDVLRTTCILPALKEKYPHCHITWITRLASVPLLQANPCLDRVYDLSQAGAVLAVEQFDMVISLDAAPQSARLATMAHALDRVGFVCHAGGYVCPANVEACYWYELGLFDDLKRQNDMTYQQIVSEICGLQYDQRYRPMLRLTGAEQAYADDFANEHDLAGSTVIGFNTGAGGRWQHKKWVPSYFLRLAELIQKHIPNCKILLYDGPQEKDRNADLVQAMPTLIDTGSDNDLRHFCDLVGLCDILVTGDTLALDVGVALEKSVVALFGPTSHAEIELYGRGRKVYADLDCLCCYRQRCERRPNCMDSITPDVVFRAVRSLTDRRAAIREPAHMGTR